MKYVLRYAAAARADIKCLYAYLLERDEEAAKRALSIIDSGMKTLGDFPFSCHKPSPENPFLRELVVPFGSGGCVLLFEIGNPGSVTILAVRHQREDDYH